MSLCGTELKGKPCKVWDSKRLLRKSCVAVDLESLKLEGKRKLEITEDLPVRIVLEDDGTEIDDNDYFQLIPDFSTFLLLRDQELWMPRSVPYEASSHRAMCCETDNLSSSIDDVSESACADDVDKVDGSNGVHRSSPRNRATKLFEQLCSGNVYKQLLPWLLLRPNDLEEIVNADPEQLARNYPRDTVDTIQEMSHRALTDYNNAQKAVQMLSLYDQAVKQTKNNK